jgi:hypothetical protein
MKKAIALLLCAVMALLAFTACTSKAEFKEQLRAQINGADGDSSADDGEDTSDSGSGDALGGLFGGLFGGGTDSGSADDGSTDDADDSGSYTVTTTQANGKTTTAGTYEFSIDDGTVFTNKWPRNEFTEMIPKPDFDVAMGGTSGNEFTILCYNVSKDDLKKYAAEVKKAGFNKDVEETDQAMFGQTLYSWEGKNSKGWKVVIGFVFGASTISVSKP